MKGGKPIVPELKPCPFCGRKVTVTIIPEFDRMSRGTTNHYGIKCDHCEVKLVKSDRGKARTTWNTRFQHEGNA